jgi:hypothetical protein
MSLQTTTISEIRGYSQNVLFICVIIAKNEAKYFDEQGFLTFTVRDATGTINCLARGKASKITMYDTMFHIGNVGEYKIKLFVEIWT